MKIEELLKVVVQFFSFMLIRVISYIEKEKKKCYGFTVY
jgi:hypothetical protein